MSMVGQAPHGTAISTREDISIWWNRRDNVYDITVRTLTWDQDNLIGPEVAEVLLWQTHTYRQARTYRWMLINERDRRAIERPTEEQG